MIVSQIFTSCEQLYSSKNTWVIIMAGNQTLLPFFLYKILSDMLHFVWGLQHFFKSKIAVLTKQKNDSKHVVQAPSDDGGLEEMEQSLPITHKEFQVENHPLEKAGKEQKVRTCLQ